MNPVLTRTVLATLLGLSTALTPPAFAQDATPATAAPAAGGGATAPATTPPAAPTDMQAPSPATPAGADAAPAAREMTPQEIAAFNKAVTDFSAGQAAQQKGDNQTAVMKYDAALPAIRTAVEADPGKIDNVNFLANALFAQAAAYGTMGQMDKVIPLYEQSLPYWRKVVEAKPQDATSRNILGGILVQIGNQKLGVQDRTGAEPYYKEALTLARKSVAEKPTDNVSKNLLLSALIGAGQTSTEEGMLEEAKTMGKAMMADGTIDATNRPAVEAMTQSGG